MMQDPPAGPTLALVEIRELVKARTSNQYPILTTEEALRNGYRLAELVGWLDRYIAGGANGLQLPEQWRG